MKTKPFKKGFIDGFLSPFNFILQMPVKISTKPTVQSAWKNAGVFICESYNNEVYALGKRYKKRK